MLRPCLSSPHLKKGAFRQFIVKDDTFEIHGISDDSNRKNQQNIIDMLRDKKFAGDTRPIVELITLEIEEKEVDVLIIKNTTNTPYYLLERYKKVCPYHIYTRIKDVNTPKDKNADINHIDILWKKRFLLDKPPLLQLKKKLSNKEEWKYTDKGIYNLYAPEYKLIEEFIESDNTPIYSYAMCNQKTFFKELLLKYNETVLQEVELVVLDSGRLKVPVPEYGYLDIGIHDLRKQYYIRYYTRNSLTYDLVKFFMDDNKYSECHSAFRRLKDVVLIFEDDEEKERFLVYSKNKIELIDKYIEENTSSYSWICVDENIIKYVVIREIKMLIAFVKLFKEYKCIC